MSGVCKECGSHAEVIDGICEDCENAHVYCGVCKEWLSRDSECRHLFWCEWDYAGAGSDHSDTKDLCKEGLFALLDLLASVEKYGHLGWCWAQEEPAKDLVDAIEARIAHNNFWTFTHGWLLCVPDVDFVEMRPLSGSPKNCGVFAHLRGSLTEAWREQDEAKHALAGDGFNWLQTLEAEKTVDANILTVEWIREWRKAKIVEGI